MYNKQFICDLLLNIFPTEEFEIIESFFNENMVLQSNQIFFFISNGELLASDVVTKTQFGYVVTSYNLDLYPYRFFNQSLHVIS